MKQQINPNGILAGIEASLLIMGHEAPPMRAFTLLIFFGLVIRLILAPFTGHPWDIKVWSDVGYRTFVTAENVYALGASQAWTWGYYAYPLREELPKEKWKKLLFAVELMDEQEGWAAPYLVLRNELKSFQTVEFTGFAIIYANRFSAYSIGYVE